MNYLPDPDHRWTVALSWHEARAPYPRDVAGGPADHKPLLVYGAVRTFDSRAEAADAVARLRREPGTWTPRHAIDPLVSDPSPVLRRYANRAAA